MIGRSELPVSLSGRGPILANWYANTVNFGDLITPFLIRRWTGRDPINLLHVHRGLNPKHHNFSRRETAVSLAQRLGLTNRPEYVMVGSILGWRAWKDDVQIVWGAGFMGETNVLLRRPRHLIAVRGERSLSLLPPEWRREVETLGDPGILVGDMVTRCEKVPGRIGFVAHYSHKALPTMRDIANDPRIHVIDVQQDVEQFVTELSTCEVIIASAMHAIIAGDGLGIPTRWVRLEHGLPPGGSFKFADYFSVAGQPQEEPDLVETADDVIDAAGEAILRDVIRIKASLLSTNPFGAHSNTLAPGASFITGRRPSSGRTKVKP